MLHDLGVIRAAPKERAAKRAEVTTNEGLLHAAEQTHGGYVSQIVTLKGQIAAQTHDYNVADAQIRGLKKARDRALALYNVEKTRRQHAGQSRPSPKETQLQVAYQRSLSQYNTAVGERTVAHNALNQLSSRLIQLGRNERTAAGKVTAASHTLAASRTELAVIESERLQAAGRLLERPFDNYTYTVEINAEQTLLQTLGGAVTDSHGVVATPFGYFRAVPDTYVGPMTSETAPSAAATPEVIWTVHQRTLSLILLAIDTLFSAPGAPLFSGSGMPLSIGGVGTDRVAVFLDLAALAAGGTGQGLLTGVMSSGHSLTVQRDASAALLNTSTGQPVPDRNDAATPKDPDQVGSLSDGTANYGSDVTVLYNAAPWSPAQDTVARQPNLELVALLSKAVAQMQGVGSL